MIETVIIVILAHIGAVTLGAILGIAIGELFMAICRKLDK